MRRLTFPRSLVLCAVWGAACTRPAPGRSEATFSEIAVPTDSLAVTPNLAVANDGSLLLSWAAAMGDGTSAVRFARMRDAAWQAPVTVVRDSGLVVNWADFGSVIALDSVRVAAGGMEEVLALDWRRKGQAPQAYDVRIARSRDGGATWGAPESPHRDSTATEHGFVSLFPDGPGRLGAAWLDGRTSLVPGGGMQLATARDSSTALGPETMADKRTCDCCQTTAVRTPDGPVVFYRDRDLNNIRDIAVTRRSKDGWSAPRIVHADGWKIDGCPVNGPAADGRAGSIAMAWFTKANDTARVWMAYSIDAGLTFMEPVRIDDGNPVGRVDVALDSQGNAWVTWLERTDSASAAVRVRRVTPDGQAAPSSLVSTTSAARASGFPRSAMRRDTLYVVWTLPGRGVKMARANVGGG